MYETTATSTDLPDFHTAGNGAMKASSGGAAGLDDLQPAYSLISYKEYAERFKPAYPYTFGPAFKSLADQLEIRLYEPDTNQVVRFPGDLTIDNTRNYCVAVPGDMVVNGSIRMMKAHGPVFIHVTGNLTAENLFLRKQGYTCIEGDAHIGTGILVSNSSDEINAPGSVCKTGSTLIMQGRTVAKVIIKSNASVLFYGSAEAYAVGDYGFCELHAAPDRFRYVMPFHEFVFSTTAGIPAPSGLFDEDGIIEGSAERYLLANRKALGDLQPAPENEKPKLPIYAATLNGDDMEAFLKKHNLVSPRQYRQQANALLKKKDYDGIFASCEEWVANTDDPFFYLVVVDACEKKKDLRCGVEWARRCLERFRSHNWMLRFLLSTDFQLGRPEDAWQDWCRFRESFRWDEAENDNILQLAVAAAINTGRTMEAYTALAPRFRTLRTGSPNFWFNAACLASQAGNPKDAVWFAWRALCNGKPREDFDAEADLNPVRDSPAFRAIMALGDTSPSQTAVLTKGDRRIEIAIDSMTVTVRDAGNTRAEEHDNPADALTAFFSAVAEAEAQGHRRPDP
ncbi:MAG: hypothetical protein WC379_11675 [Methanoregula sp.]